MGYFQQALYGLSEAAIKYHRDGRKRPYMSYVKDVVEEAVVDALDGVVSDSKLPYKHASTTNRAARLAEEAAKRKAQLKSRPPDIRKYLRGSSMDVVEEEEEGLSLFLKWANVVV